MEIGKAFRGDICERGKEGRGGGGDCTLGENMVLVVDKL